MDIGTLLYAVRNLFKKTPPKTIRDVAVESLSALIADYSEWHDAHGLYLPPTYATDPTGWSEAMHSMRRSFELLEDEMNKEGDLWEAKNNWGKWEQQDVERIKELDDEIEKGLALFGKNLLYMTDPKNGVSPGH